MTFRIDSYTKSPFIFFINVAWIFLIRFSGESSRAALTISSCSFPIMKCSRNLQGVYEKNADSIFLLLQNFLFFETFLCEI